MRGASGPRNVRLPRFPHEVRRKSHERTESRTSRHCVGSHASAGRRVGADCGERHDRGPGDRRDGRGAARRHRGSRQFRPH